MSLLLACSAPAGFAANFRAVSVAVASSSVGYDLGNQTQSAARLASKGSSQQDQLRCTEVTDPRRKEQVEPNSGTTARLIKGIWNFALFARVDEIAVRQHGGSAADGGTVDGGDQRLVEIDERVHQLRLGHVSRPGGIFRKSSTSLPGGE